MPFYEPSPTADVGMRAPQLRPPQDVDTSHSSIWGAAFNNNMLVSAYNYMTERSGMAPEADHNPLDIIRGTPYEANHLDNFIDSVSRADTYARMARIDREERDRRILDASGFEGIVASLAAGVLDPTIFMPMGTIYRGARAGQAALRSGLSAAASGAAMMAIQEGVLYGTQETRTVGESTMNVASGAILAGLLGAGIGALSRREVGHLTQTLDGIRREINDELARGPAPVGRGAGVGADAVSREHLNLSTAMTPEFRASAQGLPLAQRTAINAAGVVQDVATNLSPITRPQVSSLETSRALVRDLGDGGLGYRENWQGIPTSEGGTVETRVKLRRGPLIEAVGQMDDAYARYYFQQQTPSSFAQRQTAGFRSGWARMTGQDGGRLTRGEFQEEIGRAMRRDDAHPIPEVAEAAKIYRTKVFEPLRDEAIRLGLLPENVDVVGALSYLTRVYNRQRIIARRDEWTGILTKHFTELRDAAVTKFETKRGQKISALEQELKDLTTPAAQRPALQEQLGRDLDTLRTGNPAFVALDENLRRLRSAEVAARKVGDKEAATAARGEIRSATESGGADYSLFVSERNRLQARADRLRKHAPADAAAAGARPDRMAAFKAQHEAEIATLRRPLDVELDTLAHTRDRELTQAKSIHDQQLAASKRKDRAILRAKRNEAEARISEAHAAAVNRAEKKFAVVLRQFERAKAAERKALLGEMGAGERSANRVADIQDTIQRTKAQKGNELVELLPEELPNLVHDVTNTILGESVLRLPGISLISGPRGPLRRRILNIPDEAIEHFLESNIEKVARVYSHSMSSDIELAAKFGDVGMKDALTRLREEFNAKTDAITATGRAGERARTALERQYQSDVTDISALRDRIRGVYRQPDNPDGLMYRAGKTALSLNYMARGGGFALSQIPDFARPIMRYGLDAFRDGWIPLLNNFNNVRLAARELRLAGTALDMVRDQRMLDLADILDDFGRHSRFERGVQAMSDRFSMINLMSPMNGASKTLTGVITMAHITRAVRAVAEGKATKKQINSLAMGGIDEAAARRINQHMLDSGSQVGNVHLPNTENWRLANGLPDTKAIEAFRAAVNREVETVIVSPGLEKPLWTSYPLGRIIGQFKSFNLVSTQRVTMAGLQQRDMRALSGVVTAMALGATAAWLKAQVRGEDTTQWKTGKWISEALDQSGLIGILSEVGAVSNKVSGGRLGQAVFGNGEVSRYASRNAVGALLGPTADALADVPTVGRIGSRNWSAADTHAVGKVLPFRNLFYLRRLFDQAENGINSHFNIRPRQPPRPH